MLEKGFATLGNNRRSSITFTAFKRLLTYQFFASRKFHNIILFRIDLGYLFHHGKNSLSRVHPQCNSRNSRCGGLLHLDSDEHFPSCINESMGWNLYGLGKFV